ncbi:putative plastid-lipid-associated protein [Helianthus debilis subsp. tardiflorus]
MSLVFPNPTTPSSTHRFSTTTPRSPTLIRLPHHQNPRTIKLTTTWSSSNIPETEPLTKLASSDPPVNQDEWGIDDNGGAVVVGDDCELEDLKRCLVDSVYGTGLGFTASSEERMEVLELMTRLERVNPTPAPTDAVELLDGNWVLLYTAFSEILPLLAIGNSPLLKLERICQNINTRSSTIENSITFSTPFANFTSTTSANFEVRSPYRIQLEFKERIFQPPKIKSNIDLPENLDIFGRNINLSPVKQSLNPLQEAVANIAGVISGQAPVKVPITGERTKSWLVTYLDKDLRVSQGEGGLFVFAKEGSHLLDP